MAAKFEVIIAILVLVSYSTLARVVRTFQWRSTLLNIVTSISALLCWGTTPSAVAYSDEVEAPVSLVAHESTRDPDAPRWTVERLPPSLDVHNRVLSPDGRMVACTGSNLGDNGDEKQGLFVVELESGEIRRLIDRAIATAPAWSPDSRRLAFGNAGGYVNRYPLALVDVGTSEVESTEVMGVGAAWSPDGSEIAISTEIQRGGNWSSGVPIDGRIGIYNLKDRSMRHVTPTGFHLTTDDTVEMAGSVHPVWSPDGRWITFQLVAHSAHGEQKTDRREIWAVDRQGVQMRRLTLNFKPYKWTPGSEAILLEGGESIPLVTAPVVTDADWPKPSVEIPEEKNPRIDLETSKIFKRNKAWQNPDFDHLKSVEFVHQMTPTRLDERFSWRANGDFSVEIIRSDYPNAQKDVGRLSLLTRSGEQLTLGTASHYPKQVNLDSERQRQEMLGHLMGTRFNCVALDWGRDPRGFEVKEVRHADDRREMVLSLLPKLDAKQRSYKLNFGAMFHSTSLAYVHDLIVERVELTVDEKSGRILKEVDYISGGEHVVFEFDDWLDADDERSIPQAITISCPLHKLHVQYKFQWLSEGLWLLKSGKSWFEGMEPQFEELTDLAINKTSPSVDHHFEHLQTRLAQLESNKTSVAERKAVALNPFKFGEKYSLRWSRSNADTDRIQNLRFTIADREVSKRGVGNPLSVQLEVELTASDELVAAPAGQLILYDEQGCPVDVHAIAWEKAKSTHGPDGKEILVFDVGNSRVWQFVRQWSLTTPVDQMVSAATTNVGKTESCATYPIRVGETTPINVNGPKSTLSGNVESWLREMRLERRDDGRLAGTVELVSRSYLTDQWGTIAVVLLDEMGLPIAAADMQQAFRIDNDIYSAQVTLDFGQLPSGVAPHSACIGLELIRTGELSGSRMFHYVPRSPNVPISQLLASDSPEIIHVGLAELYGDISHDIRAARESRGRRTQRVIRQIAPYSSRMEQLFTLTQDPESLEILCRLAGHSGQSRFVKQLDGLRHHADADVQDSAAIGLALLGYSRERARLQSIHSRMKEIEDPALESRQLRNDVELALEDIGESLSSK